MEDCWSDLPVDIIGLFVKRLPIKELIRSSNVCKSWRCAANHEKKALVFAPWLMFADRESDQTSKSGGLRLCYNISSDESFNLPSPQFQGRRCWGTPYGWVITLGLDLQIDLYNPLTKQHISLPSQPTFKFRRNNEGYVKPKMMCQSFIDKFALSSDPSNSGGSPVVMAVYGSIDHLAFASPGDKGWTSLISESGIHDIIFYKDHFYSINATGMLSICCISATPEPKVKLIGIFPHFSKIRREYLFNLVDIAGDLHMILRTFKCIDGEGSKGKGYHRETIGFDIYKIDLEGIEWIGVKELNDQAVFIGNNTSFAISADDYPGVKPNCIYFTDDQSDYYRNPFCEMGVYHLKSQTKTSFLDVSRECLNLHSKFSRPFFFMPAL